ncbi:hypothetical protein N8491_00430 [Akkermansiaceae bacterium]|jgi:anti-sigma factor RsiW|nr:hypothetical protein [Akkermansiaceae bacterium]MDA7534047.1 hypothetical protein [bacterium]MDA7527112.1 hypothetical protein [Akkermansiaceae bacterium]MDA7612159.1 hypothetical protein [bacterium]MDA7635568.1 hypothetical protein [Akkermansiaceae bacterium]
MKKEKTEELFVKWIDGQLASEEEVQVVSLLQENENLEAELQEMKSVSGSLAEEIPASVDPPYCDFFNSQLMRKVDLEIHSRTPSEMRGRRAKSFRWAWAPVGALALVLSFFAGHRISRPATVTVAQGQEEDRLIQFLPTVYFAGESLKAEVIADSDGNVSAIFVHGLAAIRDDIDFATVTTSTELPKSYARSEARRFD